MINTKEHYDLMHQFEKQFKFRLDREDKSQWGAGNIYQDGEANKMFKAFRAGYALGQAIEMQNT